tara:strand:+ start:55549 stop:56379 length:831 start_codon:yes stop_codon:yes gene_type:complete
MAIVKIIKFFFSKAFWVSIGVYIVLLFIGIWCLLIYLDAVTLHAQTIKVPDLRSYHETELENLLKVEKLDYEIMDSVFVQNQQGGIVIEQTPDSGAFVKKGRKIYVTISAYDAPKVTIPNLQYDDKRNVIAQLQSIGLRIGNILYVPAACTDCLERIEINGVPLEPGNRLDQGTTVDLVFGGGQSNQFIPMPSLIGLTLEDVREKLLQAGLLIGSAVPDEEFSGEDSLKARVFKQVPDFNNDAVLFLGSTVQVFLTTDSNKIPIIPIDRLETILPE